MGLGAVALSLVAMAACGAMLPLLSLRLDAMQRRIAERVLDFKVSRRYTSVWTRTEVEGSCRAARIGTGRR